MLPEKLRNKLNLSKHKVDIWFFFLAYIYSSPAAWAKDLSSEACFTIIAWFGYPHYLSRTSHHSIQCAWNSWIWHFEFRKTRLPLRNLWNFAPCKRFRPVGSNLSIWELPYTLPYTLPKYLYQLNLVNLCLILLSSINPLLYLLKPVCWYPVCPKPSNLRKPAGDKILVQKPVPSPS